ncbi:uncharacterized protein [Medicago truncatula]|nr:uncharacterized protein LOC11428634 [Medicago truncatula]
MIAADLQRINKPAVKTIHSPDGDIIDCVLTHKQPAFDHPLLKGQKPLDPPERLRWHNQIDNLSDIFQLWSLSGESCPEGTIPIRRTTEQDILRAGSLNRFERKFTDASNGHEHSVGYLEGGVYKGAKANLNVWAPHVESQEFSLAQIWVLSGTFEKDLNSIEAGWQVSPQLYGDNRPRIFIYWTADAYKHGCYNLKCPGFVQISKKFALGAGISPVSKYNGQQFDIILSIRKDPKDGNWWLNYGPGNGIALGYWPSSLFTHLKDNADKIQFGGEIINTKSSGSHTSTQMGSGHYAEEGNGKAAYINDIQVLDSNNKVIVSPDLKYFVESPNCYTIHKDGKYLYYGGPGRNQKCT